jgi:hypothetical protein
MTKGRAALPGRVVAEQKWLFILYWWWGRQEDL